MAIIDSAPNELHSSKSRNFVAGLKKLASVSSKSSAKFLTNKFISITKF
jgi:hypothetical protein